MTKGEYLDRRLSCGFGFAIALTAVTLVAEAIGGLWTNSLDLLSDAAHIGIFPEYRLRQGEIIGRIEKMLDHDYHITHTTLLGECSRCVTGPVIHQVKHRPRRSSPRSPGHEGHDHGHHD